MLPLTSPSAVEELGLEEALQGLQDHDFDTVVDLLMLLYASPSTQTQIGRTEVEGDRAVVSVTKRIDFAADLVLEKENGSWHIDPIQTGLRSGSFTEEDARSLREAGAKEACERHMRAILLALGMYVEDYDGRLPNAERWMDQLRPYLKDQRAFHCPARPKATSGYALNPGWAGKNLRQVANRARVPLLFEIAGTDKNGRGSTFPIVAPHGGLTLVGFADGRIEWMTLEKARLYLSPDSIRSRKLFRFSK